MKISLRAKAIFFSVLTVILAILGVGIATALLGRESTAPGLTRFFGVPVAAFSLLVVLSTLLAAAVIALIWVDYAQHRRDEQIQRQLEAEVARRTEQLLHANEQLQEMDRIKTELIHRVAHELRTPLTSIMGYSEVLLQRKAGVINDLQEDFLRTVSENAARLQNLVDDVLEVSRWEVGTQRIAWEDVSLARVAAQAIESMRPVLEAKEQRYLLDAPEDTPPIRGDGAKLLQMVSNLLSNATKYTPARGQVALRVEAAGGRVQIAVEDTGIGIPEEFRPRLFDKFERAPNVEGPAYRGAGLGLYLVKQIVDAHRGAIQVESRLGKGTRVEVSFPAARQPVERPAEVHRPAPAA